jgi:hypothetical protein
VAALPDLSENLINESQTWEEIREIKAMPVPMAQKRELKNQLQVNKSLAEVSMLTTMTMLDVQAKNSHRISLLGSEQRLLKAWLRKLRKFYGFFLQKV